MNIRQMGKLTRHFDAYFGQTDSLVLHPTEDPDPLHIDVLLYPPNAKYPFWKMATMGASDFNMPPAPHTLSRYNEYMMFMDKSEDFEDRETVGWYYNKLMMVAHYPVLEGIHVTYGHSFEWGLQEEEKVFDCETDEDEMIGAFLELPQIIEDPGILRCKLGIFKTVACLQVVLLNRAEIDRLLEIGPQQFSEFLCPEQGRPHFLSQRHRSPQF